MLRTFFFCQFSRNLAEGEGFEPPEAFASTVFKTAAFDHSATPPVWGWFQSIGRAGGIRTPNRRFWRPLLYQLNYRPTQGLYPSRARLHVAREKNGLLDDLGHTARADCTATLANSESKPLLHRDRLAEFHSHRHAISRHHHLDVTFQRQGTGSHP